VFGSVYTVAVFMPSWHKNGYRIYSRISRKINDKIMPQKLGATYRRVYTRMPPRSLTAAISNRHQ